MAAAGGDQGGMPRVGLHHQPPVCLTFLDCGPQAFT